MTSDKAFFVLKYSKTALHYYTFSIPCIMIQLLLCKPKNTLTASTVAWNNYYKSYADEL